MFDRIARITKKLICAALCIAMLFPACLQISGEPAGRSPWDRWYVEMTKYTSGGVSARRGRGDLSRAMLAVIAARAADADTSPYAAAVFDDVPSGKWYSTQVAWAASAGLVRGVSDGRFEPQSAVTDDALYLALAGFYSLYGKGDDLLWRDSVYADLAGFSDWAKDAADYLDAAARLSAKSGQRSAVGEKIADYMKNYQPQDGGVRASSIKLDRSSVKLDAGETVTLTATVAPSGLSDGDLVWTVDDPSVALIGKDGRAVGVSEGYATVTVSSADGGCAASCVLAVLRAPVKDPDPARRVDPDRPMVAITFDDGPSKYTSTILDLLEKYGAVATFFEQGKNLEYWPDEVNRALAMGCEVGNHSWDHPKFKEISEAKVADQIERTNKKLIEITGKAPTLIRPPYGGRNAAIDAICKRYGMAEIIWSIDTLDWKVKDAKKICQTIRDEVYDGAVILVHSTHDFTVEAAETFIPELIAAGYQLVTVSELAEARGITLEPGVKYGGFKRK